MNAVDLDDFSIWLIDNGAEVLSTTSEWEVLRVRTNTGVHVVHQNRKGEQRWPQPLLDLVKAFNKKICVPLAATRRKRKSGKLSQQYGALVARDGTECFYCSGVLAPPEQLVPPDYAVTTEHLVSVSHGGPDHLSNKFLVHRRCNEIAGNLSAPEKIRLREEMRKERTDGCR